MTHGQLLPRADVEASQNLFYARLPVGLRARWDSLLQRVQWRPGHPVHEGGETIRYVYFPLDAVVTVINATTDGASVMLAMVGYEGLVGVPLLLSGRVANPGVRVQVQIEGVAMQLEASILRNEFQRNEEFRDLVLRYTHALMTQFGQAALCYRHHDAEEQLCTILLRALDRRRHEPIVLTHDQLATLLGVRRETISHCARKMQDAGVLEYRRGHIRVRDRGALERMACPCYRTVERAYRDVYYDPGEHSQH